MTMTLALSKANVVTPDGKALDRVLVLSRHGHLMIQTAQGSQVVDTDASAVRILTASKEWAVDTPEGTYTVTRPAGCGCG